MAEKFRWIDKLPQHALFQTLLTESEGELPVNESRNLLAERNGEIFVWSPSKNRVLTANLKNLLFENDRAKKHQELLCTGPPLYQVHMLRFSLTGKYLALVGHKGITVMEMPQRWGKFAEYQGGTKTVSCRTIPIDDRFFTVHTNSMVLEVKWHPASPLDSHLVVLTSENTLRIYNILKPETPEQVINLGDPFTTDVSYSSRSRLTSTSAFAIALGETSVSFDFGPPIKKSRLRGHRLRQDTENEDATYPMFVLRENADVYYLLFELGNKGFGLEMVGPLTMHPATENNYGLDACSILCLPLQPPVVVFATTVGRIYHCIVLESQSDDSGSDSDESGKPSAPDLTLYVHECVELQRSLAGRGGDDFSSNVSQSDESVDSLNSCPVKLYPDSSSTNHYHCRHPSGVHSIVMPWIQRLQQFFVPDSVEGVTMFDTDEEALVYHMVCTTPTSESDPSPIHGLCVVNDMLLGPSIICLTDNMECVARPLDLLKRPLPPQNTTDEEEGNAEGKSVSPMRHLLSGSFVEHIRKLLTRNTSTPLLRARPTRNLSQKDCLEILTEAQQVLREEYIQKQNYAKEEIEKRIYVLDDQKQKQEEDLENLLNQQQSVHQKAEQLAERIEDAKTRDIHLAERLEDICQQIQTHIPVLSNSEKNMKEELETIQFQVAFLNDSLSQIRAKHNHKTRRSSSSGSISPSLPLISPAQQKSIRSVLKNESDTLTDLVNQVHDLKLQVGL